MPLPQLGNSAAGKRLSNLGSAVNPAKVVSDSFEAIKGSFYEEIPELGGIVGGVKGILDDVVSDIKDTVAPDPKMEASVMQANDNIGRITDEEIEQTEIFQAMATFIDGIYDGLQTGGTPWLLLVNDNLTLVNEKLELMNEMTKNAWDVSDDTHDLMKQMLGFQQAEAKKGDFEQQVDESNSLLSNDNKDENPNDKNDKGSFLFLAGLKKVLAPLGKIMAGLLSILTLRGLGKGLFALTKNLKNITKLFGALSAGLSGFVKGAASIGKGLLRATGIGALFVSIVEGIFGGIKGGIKAYMEGGSFGDIIKGVFTGAITQIAQGFADIIVMAMKLFGSDVEFVDVGEMFSKYAAQAKEWFSGIGDRFNAWREKQSEEFEEAQKMDEQRRKERQERYMQFWSNMNDALAERLQLFGSGFKDGMEELFKSWDGLAGKMVAWMVEKIPAPLQKVFNINEVQNDLQLSPEPSVLETAVRVGDAETRLDENSIIQNNVIAQQTAMAQSPLRVDNQHGANNTYAPITSVTNTTVINGNIKTRNPESPVFIKNKVTQ